MDSPSKRILTEEGRESGSATDQSAFATGAATEDLATALRNVGARVRHSVSQGYRNPSSTFVKSQSTGTIFRSMNDTLRHVQIDSTTSPQSSDSSKKRPHSAESDGPDGEQAAESQCSNKASSYLQTAAESLAARPTKPRPLRISKSNFVRTPSFPTGSPFVAEAQPMTRAGEVVEEEDWSLNMSPEPAEQQFEAMEL